MYRYGHVRDVQAVAFGRGGNLCGSRGAGWPRAASTTARVPLREPSLLSAAKRLRSLPEAWLTAELRCRRALLRLGSVPVLSWTLGGERDRRLAGGKASAGRPPLAPGSDSRHHGCAAAPRTRLEMLLLNCLVFLPCLLRLSLCDLPSSDLGHCKVLPVRRSIHASASVFRGMHVVAGMLGLLGVERLSAGRSLEEAAESLAAEVAAVLSGQKAQSSKPTRRPPPHFLGARRPFEPWPWSAAGDRKEESATESARRALAHARFAWSVRDGP